MMAEVERAGAAYQSLIEEQLEEERDRKKTLEAKGGAVLTTSAALTTLLFGLAALVTGVEKYELPASAESPLVVAFVLFAAAALIGLAATWPMKYVEADPSALLTLTQEHFWDGNSSVGQRRTSELRVKILARARDKNRLRARLVVAGMTLEFAAAGFLTLSIYRVFEP